MINRKFFFERVRRDLFDGSLADKQVEGLETLLNEWEEHHLDKDDRWFAYMLATAFHETARTMQPIHEFGGEKYFFRMYDHKGERPHIAAQLGNSKDGDGVRFHGRGYVQLTGRRNYTRMSELVGVDLVKKPDLALDTEIASNILFQGMIEGLFTTRRLDHYLTDTEDNWIEARRIINGLDKAEKIAGHASEFYASISYTTG